MKILICDDSIYVRTKLSKFLKDYSFEVIEASNGEEAIAKNKQHSPDIVILDIIMPILDGINAMLQIKKQNKTTPVIMLSNLGQQTQIIEALQKGADEYIVKPFDPGKLLAVVEKYKDNKIPND